MLYNAKNGSLSLDGTTMDYIRFGTGERILVMLPGLGDGLRTMKGMALPFGWMYRAFGKDYTVYAFSRKNSIAEGSTTRDMARELGRAMDTLGISRADVLGVSMGGMIAQHLAADHPEKVSKLVLVVTSARPNPILTESVTQWMDQAQRGDHTALMDSNVRRIYTDAYYRRNKWMVPIMGKISKPKSYERFLRQAEACLSHDAFDALPRIQAETLVMGGKQDATLGAEASREIAGRIPNSCLKMYEHYGHGLYEEAEDFQQTVLAFLRQGREA